MKIEPDGTVPPVEDPFTEGSVESRIYRSIAKTEGKITPSEISDFANCDLQLTREYLRSFTSLGVVIKHTDAPPTYERNDAHFEWEAVKALAQQNRLNEIEDRIVDLITQIHDFQKQYSAETPADVDLKSIKISDDELSAWKNARAEFQRYNRAREIKLSDPDSGDTTFDQFP
ncbi:hypothetical protein C482_20171 [Natrialba chahannaoensis JCM 10990]|uniref:Uncharacterized protein n=1 Tax=Natrialba chahannaoensis JCM 10990 TaxID=1227492 RepID=M0A565_9EURY|nr:hypothetical protein [Natrialba chahannaoensis]ELY93027.1 hypothetical protein C482_20171 [Natrialba chahannaoensis JCM 10990]